jgi:hypothetical protein
MKLFSPEQMWTRYPNKYLAVNIASLEARRVIENMHKDDARLPVSPYEFALERTLKGDIKWAHLTEADLEALARESFDEPQVTRMPVRSQPLA